MKIRTGFVSNSSASSFIIGAAKVKDPDRLREWIDKNGRDELTILSTIEMLNSKTTSWDSIQIKGESIEVTASINSEPAVYAPFDKDGEDVYFMICIGNDEGDSNFWDGDDMNYDIDADHFRGHQKKILDLLMNSEGILENVQYHFGAGRNG